MINLSSSNFFIIAHTILSDPHKKWKVHDFESNEAQITGNIASKIFRTLIDRQILSREGGRSGPLSYCRLVSPQKLLDLSIEHFRNQDYLSWQFTTRESFEVICHRMVERGYHFILGKMTGVHERFEYVNDSKIHFHFLDKAFFNVDQRNRLSWEVGLQYVSSGGNIHFTLPRYKKFLKYKSQKKGAFEIPSDLYTYLDLKNSAYPMAEAQYTHMEKQMKAKGEWFV